MISQTGSRRNTYEETIAKLKQEMDGYLDTIKTSDAWPRLESAYRAMVAIEELAGNPRTTLDQLFALTPTPKAPPLQPSEAAPNLALGDQQESEAASELEKGA